MKAGIMIIGDEVLDGLVLDTNSNWMELKLAAHSVEMVRLVAVRDNMNEIAQALDFLRDACDVIITSGGLGPTHDDMTLKAIAAATERQLVEDERALSIIMRQYKMLHEKDIVESSAITEPRKKMALIPKGAVPLDNQIGGAPGIMLELDDTTLFCLPGVPAEMKFIFDDSVQPWLEINVTNHYSEKLVEFVWRDESKFAPFIDIAMEKHPGVYIKSMPRRYGTTDVLRVWVSARGEDADHLENLIAGAIRSLAKETGQSPKEIEFETASR